MKIQSKVEEGVTYLHIDGRVDSNTSPQLQESILESFRSTKQVVLDFEKVEYISSAGLRALLIGQKTATTKKGSMELIHVSDMVMEILETVGFAEILTIR